MRTLAKRYLIGVVLWYFFFGMPNVGAGDSLKTLLLNVLLLSLAVLAFFVVAVEKPLSLRNYWRRPKSRHGSAQTQVGSPTNTNNHHNYNSYPPDPATNNNSYYPSPSRPRPQPQPPSPIEVQFFEEWSNQLNPVAGEWETLRLYPEYEINGGQFRLDFAHLPTLTAIELDGYEYHHTKEQLTRDYERQQYLEGLGWYFIRFTGQQIHRDVRGCVALARQRILSRSGWLGLGRPPSGGATAAGTAPPYYPPPPTSGGSNPGESGGGNGKSGEGQSDWGWPPVS